MNLPGDLLRIIGHYLDPDDIINLGHINKYISTIIFGNCFQKKYGLKYLTSNVENLPINESGNIDSTKELCKIKSYKNCVNNYLLEKGYDILLTQYEETALIVNAIISKDLQFIKNVLVRNPKLINYEIIFKAANYGATDIVKFLHDNGIRYTKLQLLNHLEKMYDYIDRYDFYVETVTVLNDFLPIDSYVITDGAVESKIYNLSKKELYDSVKAGSSEVCQYLLLIGCELDLKIFKKLYNRLHVLMHLLKWKHIHKYANKILISAVRNNFPEIVKIIIENHNINIHDNEEYLLRLAAQHGITDIVQYLHELGADIHVYYEEALRFAAKNGHLETVKFLSKIGADISAQNDYAVRFAAANGHTIVVRYLHEHGANIRAKNDYGLKQAIAEMHVNTIIYLIKNGAYVRKISDNKIKKLIKTGNRELIELLPKELVN